MKFLKKRFFLTAVFLTLIISNRALAQYGPFYNEQRNLKSYSFYDDYIKIIKNYNNEKVATVALAKIDSLAQLAYAKGEYQQYLFLKNEVSNFYKFESRFDEGYSDLYDAMQNFASQEDTTNIEYAVSLRLLRGLLTRTDRTSRGEEELLNSQLTILDELNIDGEPMTNTLVDYGLYYNRQGKTDKAISMLYQARTTALEDNDLMSFAVADYTLISNMDGIDLEETIIEVLKNDLELLYKAKVNIPTLVYMSYFNYIIGNRYYWNFNDVEKAVKYNIKTTECLDTLQYPLWNLKSSSHSLLAQCYSDLMDTTRFWNHYRIAKDIALNRPMSDYNRGLALITLVEASLPISSDSSQVTLDSLEKRVDAAAFFNERIVNNQALIYLQQGQISEAIGSINKETISFDMIDSKKLPAISDTLDYKEQLAKLEILKQAYSKEGEDANREVLKNIISKQNQLYLNIVEKEVFGHEISSIISDYNKFVNASITYLLKDFNPSNDMALASRLFFSSKALQLNNNLGKSKLQGLIESDSIQFKKFLKTVNHVQEVRNKLAKENSPNENDIERELNRALIESLMARYRLSKGVDLDFQSIHIPTISEVQQRLDNKKGILELSIDDTTLNWLIITNEGAEAGQMMVDELQSKISNEIYRIKTGRTQTELGSYIFDKQLVSKLMKLNEITIIPSSELSQIPFELLELPSSSKRIIETHTVSYHYSTSLWYNSKGNNADSSVNGTPSSLLALAPTFSGSDLQQSPSIQLASNYRGKSALPPLTSSKDEVEEIYNLFKSKNIRAISLIGRNATEQNLTLEINKFYILHFATHGLVNRDNPERSGIYLYPFTRTSTENNFLSLGQLQNLKINANLAVLSACNTGSGAIAEGEGVMALPRGFIFAGVPNVIASLWKVNDERTKDLMVLFYTHLLDGNSYANALRLAKIDCIERGFLPLDWAGFVLIGS